MYDIVFAEEDLAGVEARPDHRRVVLVHFDFRRWECPVDHLACGPFADLPAIQAWVTELLSQPLCDGLTVDRLNKRAVLVATENLEHVIETKKEEPLAHHRHVHGLIMDPAKTVIYGTLESSVVGLGSQDARLEDRCHSVHCVRIQGLSSPAFPRLDGGPVCHSCHEFEHNVLRHFIAFSSAPPDPIVLEHLTKPELVEHLRKMSRTLKNAKAQCEA